MKVKKIIIKEASKLYKKQCVYLPVNHGLVCQKKLHGVWTWIWRDVETGETEFGGSNIVAWGCSLKTKGHPCTCSKQNNEIWVTSPVQLMVAMSMTYCYLSNEIFDFFFKYWLIAVAKKGWFDVKALWACFLLVTLYSRALLPSVFRSTDIY